ncbi:MAG: ABC transporter substrate-binding protein [Omnitrophica bacterium RIFCSPHIGHO2_02_FULL_63_14]|nr:MAG: ABC transporter substrate-binding protein [Omnitrophica bacterium RIFCSPHIGHO2_02_FULL_63_14]
MPLVKAKIRVGHSPDPDDAFMFYAIAHGKIPTDGIQFVHVIEDIEGLNRRAFKADLEVTAVSAFTLFEVADKYALMPCGASIGDNYGPVLVAAKSLYPKELAGRSIAVPGLHTTAYLALRLFLPEFKEIVVPFDRIIDAVQKGEADAGLIIHEGQLTYGSLGLKKIADLGEWFYEMTERPLPLGVDVIRKDLGRDVMRKATRLLKDSIEYGLRHRAEALEYAMKFGRGVPRDTADRFVGMYVNDYTLDMGRKATEGLLKLQRAGQAAGLVKSRAKIEFVEM